MRRRWFGIALLVFVAATCADQPVSSTAVHLTEFAIESNEDRLNAGTVSIDVNNLGEFPHTLVVSDASGEVLGGTPLVGPGSSTTLSLELEGGPVTFTCRIVAEVDGGVIVDHYQQGMVATIDVVSGGD